MKNLWTMSFDVHILGFAGERLAFVQRTARLDRLNQQKSEAA